MSPNPAHDVAHELASAAVIQPPPDLTRLARGFANLETGSQFGFRALLQAMANPGSRQRLVPDDFSPPDDVSPALATSLLCLLDADTTLWQSPGIAASELGDFLRFHCGCPLTPDAKRANFAVCRASELGGDSLDQFDPGSDLLPHLSTTLVIEMVSLSDGARIGLSGPGIADHRDVLLSGVGEQFWSRRRAQNDIFPQGIDLILCCGSEVIGLPRSTRLEIF